MDPLSLLYSVLTTGAVLIAKGTAGEFAKHSGKAAFEKLRDLLGSKHNVKTLGLLEEANDNPGYEAAIKGDLAKPGIAEDASVLELAETLRAAIAATPKEAMPAIEADVIEALGSQTFEDVEGIRAKKIRADGDQTFKGIRQPGK